MDERLNRKRWEQLPAEERRELLERIAEKYELELLGEETFQRWGQQSHTARFRRQDAELVFVPGDTVTLGWQEFAQGMDQETQEEFEEAMENIDWEDTLEEYLQTCMEPVHQAVIGPMLVERTLQTLGYERVPADDPRVAGNEDWMERLRKAEKEGWSGFNLVGEVRFTRTAEGWVSELYHESTFQALREELKAQGFDLPTTDEWSYLCGGGCRTLFPWGDSFDYKMCLPHFEESEDDRPYDMEEPNFFGISIAYDPYRNELTTGEDGSPVLKGGDGGCNICGGSDPAVGFLPCAPYFRLDEGYDLLDPEALDGDFDFYRRVLRIELD